MKFDVIVVGAGPAGSSAAYTLANRGYKVLLIDRGRDPGSKNVYGGRVYASPLKRIYQDLEKSAPIHRWVVKERLSLVTEDGALSVEYKTSKPTSFITYLSELARWMARKAEEAGAILATEVRVDGLVREGKKVVGVRAGPDTVKSDVVIDAEGVNRLLLERLGVVSKPSPEALAIGVKETIKVGKDKIEERLGLGDGEGMAWLLMGSVTNYIPGGAFIYTNKDTVSLGVVLFLSYAVGMIDRHVSRIVEALRLHPLLYPLWRDGDVMEYSAKLTPESHAKMMPKQFSYDGLLIAGDAAGLLLNNGLTIRGVDFAAYSGYLAAEAFEKAHNAGDFSRKTLKVYDEMLRNSFIMEELSRHSGLEYLRRYPRFFREYPKLAVKTMSRVYEIDMKSPTLWEALGEARGELGLGLFTLLRDLWSGVRKL